MKMCRSRIKIYIAVFSGMAICLLLKEKAISFSELTNWHHTEERRHYLDFSRIKSIKGPMVNSASTTECGSCKNDDFSTPITKVSNTELIYSDNKQRLERLSRICKQKPNAFRHKSKRNPYIFNTFVSDRHNLIFCQIQKAASTFWKRIIFNQTTPGTKGLPSILNLGVAEDKFKHYFKFLFVRDPYNRLFSGYIDKLFNPNVMYWKAAGIPAKRLSNPEADSSCGHDVTFAEFINYIIALEKTPDMRDRHFFSMYEHCAPCDHKIDYVGKMETFSKDSKFIFDVLKMDKGLLNKFEYMHSNSSINEIIKIADRLFNFKPKILKCMTMFDAVLRVWRQLQMKGILSRHLVFPFKADTVVKFTKRKFIKSFLRAYKSSKADISKKLNKEDALSEAYATVPQQTLMKLKQVVENDCLLFGYETKPNRVFNAHSYVKSNFFKL
ncbi:carbohydrate sulfotransferase 8-like [Mytilus californianus]|uniref:carbohydrate sulfotransferase 8-like n=1 Tax=Mytilus californianus TaxID=6549 RepID=UPI00224747E4|nr:carbohydrate sulfotransferase 8-like [Mytilus californianus]